MDRVGLEPTTLGSGDTLSRVQGGHSTAELPAHRLRRVKRLLLSFPK
jgi:hypothetical protein